MSLEQEIKQIVEGCNAKLYDIETVTERGKKIYRVTIVSPDGIDLNKCAEVSNLISPLLDVNPPIKGEYNLEVSSPGLERKLKKLSHFEHSIGENVKITTKEGDVVKGKLTAVKDGKIYLENKEPIEFEEIANAKTYVEW